MATVQGLVTLESLTLLDVDTNPGSGAGTTANIGDLAISDAGGIFVKTGAGATAWQQLPMLADFNSLTSGSVPYVNANGALAQNNAVFFWDNTNTRLGIGTNTPATTLQVSGTARATVLISDDLIRPGNTSDTTAGNIRYNGSDLQGYVGGAWRSLTGNSLTTQIFDGVSDTSTSSSTAQVMFTVTPAAGTYACWWSVDMEVSSSGQSGEIDIAVAGTRQNNSARRLSGDGGTFSGTMRGCQSTFAQATVNGSQAIQARYRSPSSGSITIRDRTFMIMRIA